LQGVVLSILRVPDRDEPVGNNDAAFFRAEKISVDHVGGIIK
jgi:hypothetical protein